ncbi:MAG TPA: transglutaminase domain-containing protein, partial [Anaerolineales bacterium]
VLLVKVDGYTPPPPMNEYTIHMPIQNIIYYWRAQTYDSYSGHTWTAGTGSQQEMGAGQSFLQGVDLVALPANYRLVTQHVTRVQTGNKTAFAAGEMLSLDRPSTVLWRDIDDIVSVSTDSDSYTASSRIQSVNAETLRAAGMDYPPSLRRYLALPDELPQRVRDLALELTANQPTPYDRAVLLETYLRQFPYSLAVPGPPSDRDAVDYFLFDLKSGYCDYYASAMVVMARTAGLPARLVLGYSTGTYNEDKQAFIVRAANAHTWAEIYFPGTGWVEFEPTPTLPRPSRAGQEPEGSHAVPLPMLGPADTLFMSLKSMRLGLLIRVLLAAAALVLVALALPLESWWLSLLPADKALKAIFHRLYRRGRSFDIPPDPSRTPHEFALALSASLERFANNGRQAAVIDRLRLDLEWLTGLYARLLFSEHPPNKEEKGKAIHTWRRLRQRMGKIYR